MPLYQSMRNLFTTVSGMRGTRGFASVYRQEPECVTGTVKIKLYKGNLTCAGRKSDLSLYDANIASMEGVKSEYDQDDATGFIKLQSLRLRQARAQAGVPAEAFAAKTKLVRE
ncbi:MAG: hypothetical protein ACLUKN_11380 [Bacilli bacterium]